MADGIFDRNLYGKCETKQALKQSLNPGQYNMFLGKYETKLNTNRCNVNSNSTISNKFNSIGTRTDIESDLKVLVRLTDCDRDKHKPCPISSTNMHCNPGVPATPYVCDRNIVPTNMKMPTSRGF